MHEVSFSSSASRVIDGGLQRRSRLVGGGAERRAARSPAAPSKGEGQRLVEKTDNKQVRTQPADLCSGPQRDGFSPEDRKKGQ